VTTNRGALSLDGPGGGTGISGYGAILRHGAWVESGGGAVTLTGAGSATGTSYNHGVVVADAGTLVRSGHLVQLTGTGGGGSGIVKVLSPVISSTSGTVTCNGGAC
jgi:hypothetical protein